MRRRRLLVALAFGAALSGGSVFAVGAPSADLKFRDDFEHGLSAWIVGGADNVGILDVGGEHGNVLRLRSDGEVHALIRGSERWGNVALEGEVQFPVPGNAYLGVIYDYRERGGRSDFGLVYIKSGRRAYLQANPHRDYNVSRTFYPEFTAPLEGASAVIPGQWQRFRVEVVDGVSHFYVGDFETPRLVFPIAEPGPGMLGLQPRSVGKDVWVDNVTVRSIERFSYAGPPRPPAGSLAAAGGGLRWEVLGPLARTDDAVARGTDPATGRWRSFAPDARGAIATGTVVDYRGPDTVAYFRTVVVAGADGPGLLRFGSVDDLAVWINGRFVGFLSREDAAWFDHGRNRDHPGDDSSIDLKAGENVIVIRARGGTYASGGFFVRIEQDGKTLRSPAGGSGQARGR